MEVIPAVNEYGMGLIPWSPLAGGLLAGALKKVTEGRRGDAYMQSEIEQHRAKLEKYEALCAELGERESDVALAWLLAQPGRDGADHRPAHRGAADVVAARARGEAGRRGVGPARRDLPGSGRTRARGLRLVTVPPSGTTRKGPTPMLQTLAEKVWDRHVVHRADGEPDLLYVDLHLVHEVTSPQAFEGLRLHGRARPPPRPHRRHDGPQRAHDTAGPVTDPISRAADGGPRAKREGVRRHALPHGRDGPGHRARDRARAGPHAARA